MNHKSFSMNVTLNFIRTLATMIFPIVVFPYVARVLSVDQIGQYSFGASVINCFALLSALGINNYAIREGARLRNDRTQISIFSSEVYTINLISMLASYILLGVSLLLLKKLYLYRQILLILSAELLLTCIGINWIYNVYEDFLFITIVTIIILFVSSIFVFLFVNDERDLLFFVGIISFANCGGNICFRIRAKKYIDIKIRFSRKLRRHFKPILLLFSSSVAAMIYVSSDTIILGFLATDYYLGLYEVSSKIYKIIKQLLLSVLVVTIPHMSMLIGNDRRVESEKFLEKILSILLFLCLPIMIGIVGVSKYIIYIIAGEKYLEATPSLRILGIALLFSILSSFFANCVLIPVKKEKILLWATGACALLNIVGNLLLIPIFKEKAAAFTTVISELLLATICGFNATKCFKIHISKRLLFSIFLGCIMVAIICYITVLNVQMPVLGIAISFIGSLIAYLVVNLVTRSPIIGIFKEVAELQKNK